MKRLRLLIRLSWVGLMALLLNKTTPLTAVPQSTNDFVPEQIVVKLNPASGATIDQINAAYATSTIRALVDATGVYLLRAPSGADAKALAETMATDSRLLYAEPNHFSQVIEGEARVKWARAGADPAVVGTQYAGTLLDLAAAQALSTGANTVVAVLDTGFQLDHPQLAASFTTARYDFIDNDAVPTEEFSTLDPDGDGFVNELAGHGTHVAGIVHLVAPDAQIMPLRVMDSNGLGDEFAVVEAVRYAVAQGADVINLSLGTTAKSELLIDVIEKAFDSDQVVIVTAAGNGNTNEKLWPAATSHAVAVTSVGPTKEKSAFANFGSWVDIAAPGEDVISAFPNNQFASWSGTSFATPFIAGQLALLRSVNSTLKNDKLIEILRDTAEPLPGDIGAGFPDLAASVQSAQQAGEETPTATVTPSITPTATLIVPPTVSTTPTGQPTATATAQPATPTPLPGSPTPISTATPTPPGGVDIPTANFHLYLGIIKK